MFLSFKAVFFLCFSAGLMVTCTTTKKNSVSEKQKLPVVDPSDQALFEKAFENMGEGNYYTTIPVFKKLADKYKGNDLEWASLFNLGGVYKELGLCDKSQNVYEKLLRVEQLELQIKSKTYLNLSYVYECLGKEDQAFLALKQGMELNRDLSVEEKSIEYPFRLSLAYFRAGELEKGKEFQERVVTNLNLLKSSFLVASEAEEKFAEIFYQIGRTYVKAQHIDLKSYLRIFTWHQMYLCQSVMMNVEEWQTKSLYELNKLYNHFFIKATNVKDKDAKKIWVKEIMVKLDELQFLLEAGQSEDLNAFYKKMKKKAVSLGKSA